MRDRTQVFNASVNPSTSLRANPWLQHKSFDSEAESIQNNPFEPRSFGQTDFAQRESDPYPQKSSVAFSFADISLFPAAQASIQTKCEACGEERLQRYSLADTLQLQEEDSDWVSDVSAPEQEDLISGEEMSFEEETLSSSEGLLAEQEDSTLDTNSQSCPGSVSNPTWSLDESGISTGNTYVKAATFLNFINQANSMMTVTVIMSTGDRSQINLVPSAKGGIRAISPKSLVGGTIIVEVAGDKGSKTFHDIVVCP